MPGPKTHAVFYKELKEKLSDTTLNSFPNYDDYALFAQGHDFLIYHDFYKIKSTKQLNDNLENSVLLQEYDFPEFVYQFLKTATENGAIEEEQTRLFIGAGYVMHHLLDAYTHPQIIYYSGDHVRDPKNKTWMHGIVENLIDIYMMKYKEHLDPKKYPVYRDFSPQFEVSSRLIQTLDDSLKATYQIDHGGHTFEKSFTQLELFMRIFKYDRLGVKQKVFDAVDPIVKGSSSFSYHRDFDAALKYLNLEHEIWYHPMDNDISSQESFLDLYNKALMEGASIVDELEKICQSGSIKKDDIYSIIPNVSSVHGLACGQKLKIKNRKTW